MAKQVGYVCAIIAQNTRFMDIYVQKNGQPKGPFTETRLREGIDAGEFVPADLAWRTGTASWQPLSKFINLDLNRPPPISELTPTPSIPAAVPFDDEVLPIGDHVATSVEASTSPEFPCVKEPSPVSQPTSPTRPPNVHANETVLFQDETGEDPVLVTNTRVKVGDITFSFKDVTSVRFEVIRKPCVGYWRLTPVFWWVLLVIFCWMAISEPQSLGYALFGIIGSLYTAIKSTKNACWNYYNDAQVILEHPNERIICYSKICRLKADQVKSTTIESRKEMDRWNSEDFQVPRLITDAISIAIGSAIGHKPNVTAE